MLSASKVLAALRPLSGHRKRVSTLDEEVMESADRMQLPKTDIHLTC